MTAEPKRAAKYSQEWRERQKKAGRRLIQLWMTEEEEAQLRQKLARIRRINAE